MQFAISILKTICSFLYRIKKDKEDAAWALQCDALYDTSKFKPAPYITDHGNLFLVLCSLLDKH